MTKTIEDFPALIEFRKHGSLIEIMQDKGFDESQIHYFHQGFGIGDIIIQYPCSMSIFDAPERLQAEEDLHILLNHTKHYTR